MLIMLRPKTVQKALFNHKNMLREISSNARRYPANQREQVIGHRL